jgi:2-amino-4-hydroxy-6-hydroxymethyldihydropteridine diphosphokinase
MPRSWVEQRLRRRSCSLRIQQIEHQRGRERPYTNAPRTLDLDLILYGDAVISLPAIRRAASALSRTPVRAGAAGGDRAKAWSIR